VWFSTADKHAEDERIDQAAFTQSIQALHEAGALQEQSTELGAPAFTSITLVTLGLHGEQCALSA